MRYELLLIFLLNLIVERSAQIYVNNFLGGSPTVNFINPIYNNQSQGFAAIQDLLTSNNSYVKGLLSGYSPLDPLLLPPVLPKPLPGQTTSPVQPSVSASSFADSAFAKILLNPSGLNITLPCNSTPVVSPSCNSGAQSIPPCGGQSKVCAQNETFNSCPASCGDGCRTFFLPVVTTGCGSPACSCQEGFYRSPLTGRCVLACDCPPTNQYDYINNQPIVPCPVTTTEAPQPSSTTKSPFGFTTEPSIRSKRFASTRFPPRD